MYAYQEKNTLFQSLRTEVALLYVAILVFLALFFSHPLFLLALLLALNVVIFSAGIMREWLVYLKFTLLLTALIILVNTLFVQEGATVLLRSPRLPLIGTVRITWEALCFGVGMGLRLVVMTGAFCLLTYAVHPDRILQTLGGGNSKILLTLSISIRLLPLAAADFTRITEAQRCRGVNFQVRGLDAKIRKYIPVFNTVLLSSLERSFQLAESLQSRGYGAGRRTFLRESLWRIRDYLVLAALLLAVVYAVLLFFTGWGVYSYYPRLQPVTGEEMILAAGLALFFLFPAILNWGWVRWRFLRLKI
ncbi:MAG: energy-coupling factor transporter transmembrane component T [Clostridia bacterium]|jgi:energy-coupling factor transport system permease protein|nr:energy-coupling factor transporter transmembrane component T [Clostridia bacterium]